ncbi:UNVERIFIED_CONTAM: Nesprin-3 [Gekko kuhli]
MTQQPQDEFESSVESAVDWMKTIQERLRINDNTKGPRSALEARLRDTEKTVWMAERSYILTHCVSYLTLFLRE